MSRSCGGLALAEQPDAEVGKLEVFTFHFAGGSGMGRLAEAIRFHGTVELQERRMVGRVMAPAFR